MTPCSRFVGATTPKQLFSQRRGNSKQLRRSLSCPACGDGGSAVVTMVVGMRLRTRCASFGGGWRCGSLTRARGGLDEYSEGARCFYGAAAKRPPIEAKTYVCRPRRPHDRLLHDAGAAAVPRYCRYAIRPVVTSNSNIVTSEGSAHGKRDGWTELPSASGTLHLPLSCTPIHFVRPLRRASNILHFHDEAVRLTP